jgi:hypothetical protein
VIVLIIKKVPWSIGWDRRSLFKGDLGVTLTPSGWLAFASCLPLTSLHILELKVNLNKLVLHNKKYEYYIT